MTTFKKYFFLTEKRRKSKKRNWHDKHTGKFPIFWHGTPLGGYVQHANSEGGEMGVEDAIQ